ncbi:MAG: malonate transporter subunit MadL [Rhodothermales bacterium]
MVIYGTALLSLSLLAGMLAGEVLGWLIGVDANVGGVGIAMLLLIVGTDRLRAAGRMMPASEQGILFWSAIYIPIVVAMAASQNVVKAVNGGVAAVAAGVLVVVVCFALVPVIARIGRAEGEA